MRVRAWVLVAAVALAPALARAQQPDVSSSRPAAAEQGDADEGAELARKPESKRDVRLRGLASTPESAFRALKAADDRIAAALAQRDAALQERSAGVLDRWGPIALAIVIMASLALASLCPFLVARSKAHEGRYAILGGAIVATALTLVGFALAMDSPGGSATFALPCTTGAVAWFGLLAWSVYPDLGRKA